MFQTEHPGNHPLCLVKWNFRGWAEVVPNLPQGLVVLRDWRKGGGRLNRKSSLIFDSGCRCAPSWATLERVSDVTRILEAAQQGDPTAADQLLPLVYEELRRLAAHKMSNEAPGHTLQPTALVHEGWLRLARSEPQGWEGRTHYVGAA